MKIKMLSLSIALAGILGVSASAASVDVNVPFEFSAGGTTLPAGAYTMSVDSANVLVIRGAEMSAAIMATPEATSSMKPAAIFDQAKGKSNLYKVNLAGGVSYVLISSKRTTPSAAAIPGDVLLSRH